MVEVRVALPTHVRALTHLEKSRLNRLWNALVLYQGMASAMPQTNVSVLYQGMASAMPQLQQHKFGL
jgi:hypothetical protein